MRPSDAPPEPEPLQPQAWEAAWEPTAEPPGGGRADNGWEAWEPTAGPTGPTVWEPADEPADGPADEPADEPTRPAPPAVGRARGSTLIVGRRRAGKSHLVRALLRARHPRRAGPPEGLIVDPRAVEAPAYLEFAPPDGVLDEADEEALGALARRLRERAVRARVLGEPPPPDAALLVLDDPAPPAAPWRAGPLPGLLRGAADLGLDLVVTASCAAALPPETLADFDAVFLLSAAPADARALREARGWEGSERWWTSVLARAARGGGRCLVLDALERRVDWYAAPPEPTRPPGPGPGPEAAALLRRWRADSQPCSTGSETSRWSSDSESGEGGGGSRGSRGSCSGDALSSSEESVSWAARLPPPWWVALAGAVTEAAAWVWTGL